MKCTTLTEFQDEARRFTATLQPREDRATLVTLSGELGAGKTTFVQTVASSLGIIEDVTSPTFVIEKVYALQDQTFERLIHIDAYRLHEVHELEVLGWKELIADPGNLIMLEWPEKVAPIIPEHALRLRFDIQGDGRIITLDGN